MWAVGWFIVVEMTHQSWLMMTHQSWLICISHKPIAKLTAAVPSFQSIASAVISRPGKNESAVQYTKKAKVALPTIHPAKRLGSAGMASGPIFFPSEGCIQASINAKTKEMQGQLWCLKIWV
jgi:hypothetical protein